VNHGKSALVVKAIRTGEEAALKIFDPDLVDRFGRSIQLGRIQREKSLIGKSHPHLIEIKNGGACQDTNYLYIAMAYLPHKNLAQILSYLPHDRIFPIIGQVAEAAKYLEQMGLVHPIATLAEGFPILIKGTLAWQFLISTKPVKWDISRDAMRLRESWAGKSLP